jgi:hypothetical protein
MCQRDLNCRDNLKPHPPTTKARPSVWFGAQEAADYHVVVISCTLADVSGLDFAIGGDMVVTMTILGLNPPRKRIDSEHFSCIPL